MSHHPVAVDRLVVVVPARDEEMLLPACLAALRASAVVLREDPTAPSLRVVVVADCCTDATAAISLARGAEVVVGTSGRVGAARDTGIRHALRGSTPDTLRRTWIANTDADSRVPRGWLRQQLTAARAGTDLLLGTVDLVPEEGGDETAHRWRAEYRRRSATMAGDAHPHVHGANLGVRADTYVRAGGFPHVAADEDVLLALAADALDGTIRSSPSDLPVLTSARRVGRARRGVAADLAVLD